MGLELAKKYNGVIVSADSRQIYRGMNIGTDKIQGEMKEDNDGRVFIESEGIAHYLIDVCDIDNDYTIFDYQKQANEVIDVILAKEKLPMLVGGTGLYIACVIDNYQLPPRKFDPVLRTQLESESLEELLISLHQKSPRTALIVDQHNKRRVLRALEFAMEQGSELSESGKKGTPRYETLQLGIKTDRNVLYSRIDERVDQYIETGLVSEVEELLKSYDPALPPLSGIGYRQIILHLKGDILLTDAVRLIKRDTRRYARRQMTWFKRDRRIQWVNNQEEAENIVSSFLKGMPLNVFS